MEIVTRRKNLSKDKHLLPESTDVVPASIVSVWKSWTACLVLACICTIFTLIWLDGTNSEAKMTVNPRQFTKLPAISSSEDNAGFPVSLSENQRSVYVQDAVVFPDNVMLVVRVPNSVDLKGNMESLECRFGGMKLKNQSTTPVISIKPRTKDLHMVRCSIPGWVKEFPGKHHKAVTLGIRDSNVMVQSAALYKPGRLPKWDYVVYESLQDNDSIVLLVKGLVTRSARRIDVNFVRCIFGKKLTSKHLFETRVLTSAQEVVRCEKPPPHLEEKLRGYHMSIAASWLGVLPSVVYYNPDNKANYFMESFAITSQEKKEDYFSSEDEVISSAVSKDESSSSDSEPFDLSSLTSLVPPKRKLCACTMLWNKAQFFKEWVLYHSFMGVERYFLYDNDSDDNIEEVVESLAAHNISRMIWPWIKTQQAAFSHCTILAREECEWMMFIDVDEYIYPIYYLATSNWTSTSDARVLLRVIDMESEKAAQHGGNLGEIQFDCHNFGPSGLAHSPKQGVTVGYTCRVIHPERHKSIVRLAAVNDTLLNVLHHFQLRSEYHTTKLMRSVGVVNHYKFQAWDVFKMKFVRRAGTYTTDWKKSENTGSKDRTPGLGTEAVKPDDWEKRFCEIEDRRLIEFVLRTFQRPDQPDKLLWEDQ